MMENSEGSAPCHFFSLALEDFLGDGGDLSILLQLFASGGPQRKGFPS